jgi:hypothetical protein
MPGKYCRFIVTRLAYFLLSMLLLAALELVQKRRWKDLEGVGS